MMRHQVTAADYRRCVEAQACLIVDEDAVPRSSRWSRSAGGMPTPMRPGCRARPASPSACRPTGVGLRGGQPRCRGASPRKRPKAPIRAGARSPFMIGTPIATLGASLAATLTATLAASLAAAWPRACARQDAAADRHFRGQ